MGHQIRTILLVFAAFGQLSTVVIAGERAAPLENARAFGTIDLSSVSFHQTKQLYPDLKLGRQWRDGAPFDISALDLVVHAGWKVWIPVGLGQVAELAILHCVRGSVGPPGPRGAYLVRYDDGSTERIAIHYPGNVNYPFAHYTTAAATKGPAGFFLLRWRNPNPEKVITALGVCPDLMRVKGAFMQFDLEVLAITVRAADGKFVRVPKRSIAVALERDLSAEAERGKVLRWRAAPVQRPRLLPERAVATLRRRVASAPYAGIYAEYKARAERATSWAGMQFAALVVLVEGRSATLGSPRSWHQTTWKGSGRFDRVEDEKRTGEASVRIDSSEKTFSDAWDTGVRQAAHVHKGAHLAVQCYASDGKRLGEVHTSRFLTGTRDWTRLRVEFKAVGERARLICSFQGQGTAWFDDLALTEAGGRGRVNLAPNPGFEQAPTFTERSARLLLDGLEESWREVIRGVRYERFSAYAVGRYVQAACYTYDALAFLHALTPQEDALARRRLAFLSYKLMDRSYFDFDESGKGWNHNTDRYVAVGSFSLCFPGHPQSSEWLTHAVAQFDAQMRNYLLPDGAAPESPRYHGWVLQTWIPFAYAMRRNTDVDLFARPRLKAALWWLARVQTPAMPSYAKFMASGGAPGFGVSSALSAERREAIALTPGIGDGNWCHLWAAPLGWAVKGRERSDPKFARCLAWAWSQAGKPFCSSFAPGLPLPGFALSNVEVEAEKPQMKSFVSDIGYAILRASPDYFLLNGARSGLVHQHNDRGSFSLIADRRPIALDPGVVNYGPRCSSGMGTIPHHTTSSLSALTSTFSRMRSTGLALARRSLPPMRTTSE